MATTNGVGPHCNGDANAAGQPDTPVEVLTALLGKALKLQDPAAVRELVQQAYAVVAGLDPYLDQISTPPSQASDCTDLHGCTLQAVCLNRQQYVRLTSCSQTVWPCMRRASVPTPVRI